MKKNKNISQFGAFALICVMTISSGVPTLHAEDNIKNEFNPVNTGVTSLSIAPDARGAALGDLGAATDPDVNSQFWNPSKYAFAYSQGSIGLSYTPWLRKLVNDIFLADLAGYWKLGSQDNQALSASLRYFSLGEVSTTDVAGVTNSINPYEMAIAFAADLAGYFTTYPIIGQNECQWSWGFNVSNIGSKVAYDNGNNPAFLPTNLRLGTTFMFPLADYHTLAFSLDLNKLLVPTRPRQQDYIDADGQEDQEAFQKALDDWKDMSPITGIFKSFNDAPGGMKEEIREINYSIGAEYSYNQQFFLRAGYYHESEYKGNRQYFGFGAGFSLNVVRLDASYMLATAQTSPLDQTLRFTLSFDMDGLKNLLGRK